MNTSVKTMEIKVVLPAGMYHALALFLAKRNSALPRYFYPKHSASLC